jgi:hypothetical protein
MVVILGIFGSKVCLHSNTPSFWTGIFVLDLCGNMSGGAKNLKPVFQLHGDRGACP